VVSFLNELDSRGFRKSEDKYVVDITLTFYYQIKENGEIRWKNIFDTFGINNENLRMKDIKGIILISHNENRYAITYGNYAYVEQNYCDSEFGYHLAKRIELKELKRKSSTTNRSRGRKGEVNTYVNENTLDIEYGKVFTSLSFTPVDDSLGKRLDFGKSIRL